MLEALTGFNHAQRHIINLKANQSYEKSNELCISHLLEKAKSSGFNYETIIFINAHGDFNGFSKVLVTTNKD